MSLFSAQVMAETPSLSSMRRPQSVAAIKDLAKELTDYEQRVRARTIGNITKKQERGPHFEANVMSYIGALEFARRAYMRKIAETALTIANDVNRCSLHETGHKLWLSLMLALEPLSGRPSKKHAALLVDQANRLVVWDVARVPRGIKKSASLFLERDGTHRGTWIRCAEQNCVAQLCGIVAKGAGANGLNALADVGKRYFEDIQKAAQTFGKLQDLTMYARLPCSPCADLLIAPEDNSLLLSGLVVVEGQPMTNGIRKPKEACRRFSECSPPMRVVSLSDLALR